jgi:hypothetical protein
VRFYATFFGRRPRPLSAIANDFNACRCHSQVVATPNPLVPHDAAKRPRRTLPCSPMSPRTSRRFETPRFHAAPQHEVRGAHPVRLDLFGRRHRKEPAGLATFLKNNTTPLPVWQEIVDFSQSSVPALNRRSHRSSRTPSDLSGGIPITQRRGRRGTRFLPATPPRRARPIVLAWFR